MLFSMEEEVFIFLYAILTGAVICMLYDLVSVCTKKSTCPIFVCNMLDGITLLITCVILLYVSISVSRGIVRFFEFVGVFLGILLYKLLLSRLVCAIFCKITEIFCTFFKVFFKILLTPVQFMYKIFSKCINGLLCPIMWIGRKTLRVVSSRLESAFHVFRKARNKT